MTISSIHIKNFRSLSDINIADFDPNLNLFLGINGAGKSSVLDALAMLLSWFSARIFSKKGKGAEISKEDVTQGSDGNSSIQIDFTDGSHWKLYKSLGYNKQGKSDLTDLTLTVSNIRMELETNPLYPLPVIIYYGVNRAVPDFYPKRPQYRNFNDRLDIYRNFRNNSLLFNDFFNWFRNAEDIENEKRRDNPHFSLPSLVAVKKALELALPGYKNPRISRSPLYLYMEKDGVKFKFNQLSDGEKVYISMVADIARRLAVANEGSENPLEGNGIILIDEIDLHLHPQWQKDIISKFSKIFPGIQFFLSSHSPMVASDVNGKVFLIDGGEITEKKTYGKTSSQILSSDFNLPNQRSLAVQNKIDQTYHKIEENDIIGYNHNLEELKSILGVDDLVIARLQLEKHRYDNFHQQ